MQCMVFSGEKLRIGLREEMTTDEVGQSKVSEASTMPPAKALRAKMRKGKKKGVPKKAEVIMLAELRLTKCDQCEANDQQCMPHIKGGQLLNACTECFG